MELEILGFVAILAIALGLILGRYACPVRRGVDPVELTKAQTEAERLARECIDLRNKIAELEAERKASHESLRSAAEEKGRLTEQANSLSKQLNEQSSANQNLEAKLADSASKANALAVNVAELKQREKDLTEKIESLNQQLMEQQKLLTAEFENIANRILKSNITELSETSQKNLAAILDPLRERIQEFQKKVESTYESESRDVLSLKEQIKHVVETSRSIGNQADGLAKALRGDSQMRGRWGELALERILEAAGLTEGREFITQGRGMKLRNEDGGIQKPDVVIMLPEGRTMIIDSKVSLVSYERLISPELSASSSAALPSEPELAGQFIRDVKAHIDGLSGKRYQENEKLQAHDCVLMFVPIEGALAAALTHDPELFLYAWNRQVVLVGPSTLLMTLRTVASIWRYERQNQNAQEIARLAGDLCDKLAASLSDLNNVLKKLDDARSVHEEAVKRLYTGNNNAVAIGKRIREMGVKGKKEFPPMPVQFDSETYEPNLLPEEQN